MNRTKTIFLIIGALLLVGGVVAGILLVQQNQDLSKKAAPATVMYISPASQSKNPGDTFTAVVQMDTGSNFITGFDVRLNFDPNTVQIDSLQLGSGVTNLNNIFKNTFDNTAGTLQYATFTLNSSNAVNGSGLEVLKVNGTIKNSSRNTTSSITFDPATAATASQEGQNVITSMSPGSITVGNGTGTVAPTPTTGPTNTASPSPTGLRTATPTATATSTTSPTNAPTTSATSTATAAATSTSNATARPSATSTARAASPTPATLPASGTSWVSYLGIGLGLFAIVGAFLLAL